MNKQKVKQLGDILGITFPDDIEITHATNSSKKIRKNSIFFGLQGTKVHGSKFIEEALELGASVAVHDDPNFKINNKDLENKIFYIEDIDEPWTAGIDKEWIEVYDDPNLKINNQDLKSRIFYIEDYDEDTDKTWIEAKNSYHYFIRSRIQSFDETVPVNFYNKLLIFLIELNSDCALLREFNLLPIFTGFTGTNGKTTSAVMASQLGAKLFYGEESTFSIYIGTLGFQYSYYDFNRYETINTNFDSSLSNNTTPDIFEIFEILKKISGDMPREYSEMSSNKALRINIEVSSHALDQGRLKYIPFDKVALMNIGSDHLDYHKNIYDYESSKLKIFDLVHPWGQKYIGIDNINIKSKAFKKYSITQEKIKTISFKDNSADIYCQINHPVKIDGENAFKITENKILRTLIDYRSQRHPFTGKELGGISLISRHSNEEVLINNKKSKFYTKLLKEKGQVLIKEDMRNATIKTSSPDRGYICKIFPEYNIENLVFSIALTFKSLTEVDASIFYDFEESDPFYEYRNRGMYGDDVHRNPIILSDRVHLPPGRAELMPNIPANVIIDYAHNTEGFDFFLSSINDSYKKLIIIFGCGGDRDKEKRPKMLAAAIQYGYKVIFTSDNSRSERFKDIFNDASIGNDIKDVLIIEDRKEAIIRGSQLIGNNDCLVILGKGHEDTQETNGEIIYFNDYEVVNEIYK